MSLKKHVIDFWRLLRGPKIESDPLYLEADAIGCPSLKDGETLDDEFIYNYAIMRFEKSLAIESLLESRADRYSHFCVVVMTGLIIGTSQIGSIYANIFLILAATCLFAAVILALIAQSVHMRFAAPSIAKILHYKTKQADISKLALSLHVATVGTDLLNHWTSSVIDKCRKLICVSMLFVFVALVIQFPTNPKPENPSTNSPPVAAVAN